MAEQTLYRHPHDQITAKSMLLASAAGLVVAGPLLALMGLSFLATMVLFAVAFPLLILFSPVLIGGLFVLGVAMAGFAAATTLGMAGLSAFRFVLRSSSGITTSLGFGGSGAGAGVSDKFWERDHTWAGRLMESSDENSPEDSAANKRRNVSVE